MSKQTLIVTLGLVLLLSSPLFAGKAIWTGIGGDPGNTNSSPYPVSTSTTVVEKFAVSSSDGQFERTSGICLADCGSDAAPYVFGSTGWGGNKPYRYSRVDGSTTGWVAQSGTNDSGSGFFVGVSPDGKYVIHQDVNTGNPASPNIRGYSSSVNPAGVASWGVFVQDSLGYPKIGPDNRFYGRGRPFGTGTDMLVYALDAATGSLVWTAPDDAQNGRPGAFYDTGSTLAYVVSGTSTKMVAWDTQGAYGATLWSYTDTVGGNAAPTVDPATGTVYAFRGTRPIALDSTGTLVWEGDAIGSSPAESVADCGALSQDGSVYYVQSRTGYTGWTTMGYAGKLYAYDTSDGSVKWSYNTETRWGEPVVSSNGVIFVNNGNIMDPPWAGTNWPGKNQVYAVKDEGTSATLLWTKGMNINPDTSGGWIAIGPGAVYFDGVDESSNVRLWALTGPDLPLMIETTSIADAKINSAYSFTLTGLGGTTPYSWSATGLPAGLSIDAGTGELSGTVTTAGTYEFTITLTDSATLAVDERAFSLSVAGSEIVPWTTAKSVIVGGSFSDTITTDVDLSPYTWTLVGGALPPGITDDGSTTNVLTLSGTATAPGTYDFTFQSVDSVPWTDTETFQITVDPMEITGAFPTGGVNFLYDASLTPVGGFGPYTWSFDGGILPYRYHTEYKYRAPSAAPPLRLACSISRFQSSIQARLRTRPRASSQSRSRISGSRSSHFPYITESRALPTRPRHSRKCQPALLR